jgi:Kef-type K+ transport system membrane component KefB
MAQASRSGFVIALGGIALPFVLAWAVGTYFFPPSDFQIAQILFLATALSVTAVPVAIKVLMNTGKLETGLGRSIVSAAVIDDALSLMLLAAMTTVIHSGSLPGGSALIIMACKIGAFFVVTSLVGHYLFPALGRLLKKTSAEEFEFSMLLTAAFAYAVLAELLGMHFILGAFQAGLFFRRKTVDEKTFERVDKRVKGITNGFLAPIFFASVGLHIELSAIFAIPGFVAILITAATVGKVWGAGLAARAVGFDARESLAIGFAMNARGAVELIIADIALRAGIFSSAQSPVVEHLFSAVVIMAVVTTLMTPVFLGLIFGAFEKRKA